MIAESDLGRKIETLAQQYDLAKKQLEGHPQYERIGKILQKDLPPEALQLIKSYETARGKLIEQGIPVDSILPEMHHSSVLVTLEGEYIKLENLVCVDADGNEFERYGELYVRTDIFRDQRGQQQNFTPYNGAVYCEQNGLFLPSFALSCNILQALFQQRSIPEIKRVLDHYKDKGNGTGYHGQNTIIDFGAENVIHYPTATEFNQTGAVNSARSRRRGTFDKSTLQDCLLEDALREAEPTRYVKQLSGLRNPSILVEIGDYFGRPAKLWFPWNGKKGANYREKRAAWLGCDSINFNLFAYSNLDIYDAARGVRFDMPAGYAP